MTKDLYNNNYVSKNFYIALQKLVHDFLFPASRLVVESRVKKCEFSIVDDQLVYYAVNFSI